MPSSRLGLIEQILQSRAHDWMDGQEPIANSGKLENIDSAQVQRDKTMKGEREWGILGYNSFSCRPSHRAW